MSKLEVEEEDVVSKWCARHKVLYIKFTPYGEVGWPDRICVFPSGVTVWMEMKRKGKAPRKIQRYRMKILREHNANVEWADTAKLAMELLEKYL